MIQVEAGLTIGKYRITEFLGRGGFSLVYLAEDRDTRERVALKMGDRSGGGRFVDRFAEVTPKRSPGGVSPDESPADAVFFEGGSARVDFLDEQEIDRLLIAESETLRRVRSPHVVSIREVVRRDGRPVLVLEHVRGKTLRDKIRALEGIRLNWFLTIARTLERLRSTGELPYHGDLKPENIVVRPQGQVALLDPVPVSPSGPVPATLNYNPLLLRDSKADVMAVGVMLYEILTGALPFDEVPWEYAGTKAGGETVRLSLSYFLSYVPPRELNPNTPPDLEKIVYRCLAVPEYGLEGLRDDLVTFLRRA
ncbi:MAG TPA: serine/threonine-protein kinase [Planctomycetota bacterium]|nr:serine/threonine-protein kinase [Planctomycetota bacterium]